MPTPIGLANAARADGVRQPSLRRCIVTGGRGEKCGLIRFVIDPDGRVVPDIRARLPGRGMWLSAERNVLHTACTRKVFARAARRQVEVATDLAAMVEAQLARACMDTLGLARRAGLVLTGYEKVRRLIAANEAVVVLGARDAAPDGKRKMRRLCAPLPWIELFDTAELSGALGRDNVVHVALKEGGLARRLMDDARRLSGVRDEGPRGSAGQIDE